jgi:hypothetical protein
MFTVPFCLQIVFIAIVGIIVIVIIEFAREDNDSW